MTTLALVGTGKWGQNYIKTISNLPGVSLPKKYIKTRDYSDLFSKKSDIDGVIIATPTGTHFKIAKDFIDNGFSNLLIEKPVTQTYEQASDLQEVAKKNKSFVMVGHIQIYDPAYQELKKNLSKIGNIKTLNYQGLQSPPRTDATVLQDWGPHPIYLFMDIMDSKPDTVSIGHLKGTPNDNVRLILKFGKARATADIGWTYLERKRNLEVKGSKGSLTLDGTESIKKLVLNNDDRKVNLNFPLNISPLALQIREFVHCIQTGKETRKTPLSQGVAVMKIIES